MVTGVAPSGRPSTVTSAPSGDEVKATRQAAVDAAAGGAGATGAAGVASVFAAAAAGAAGG